MGSESSPPFRSHLPPLKLLLPLGMARPSTCKDPTLSTRAAFKSTAFSRSFLNSDLLLDQKKVKELPVDVTNTPLIHKKSHIYRSKLSFFRNSAIFFLPSFAPETNSLNGTEGVVKGRAGPREHRSKVTDRTERRLPQVHLPCRLLLLSQRGSGRGGNTSFSRHHLSPKS